MGRNGSIRRYTTPRKGSAPLAVARAAVEPLRVLIRNEGSGGPEGAALPVPAPLFPFNFLGPPLTVPCDSLQPCRLSNNFNDLIYTPDSQYKLTDGGSDLFLLAPGQTLYATADSTDPVVISVQEIEGTLIGDAYLFSL
jgi:hypothetical protein